MRPDNKKAGSGQATGKDGHLFGVNGHSQPQGNEPARNFKQPYTDKQLDQILIDMWCTLRDWPNRIRFSVQADGQLLREVGR